MFLFVRDTWFLDIREQRRTNVGIKCCLYTIGSLARILCSSTRSSFSLPSCPESEKGKSPWAQNMNRSPKTLYMWTDKHQTESEISKLFDILFHFGYGSPFSPTPSFWKLYIKANTPKFVPSECFRNYTKRIFSSYF